MTQRQRIHKTKRLVCVYHNSLGMFEVYKINRNGRVNKKVAVQFSFTDDVHEAFRNMTYPFAGFKTVSKAHELKAKTWYEYIEMVWALGNK